MSTEARPLSRGLKNALVFLASSGSMMRGIRNDYPYGVMSGRTASALERRGFAERRYTGANEAKIYVTGKGATLAAGWDQDPDDEPIENAGARG